MSGAVAIVFANLKGNLGDLAILEANLSRLSAAYPGRSLDVWTSGFVKQDKDLLRVFMNAGAPPFRLRGTTPDIPLRRCRKAFASFGFDQALQPRFIDMSRRSFGASARLFAQYERVFVVGGDQFDTVPSASMFGTLKAIAEFNPRISNFPLSINPRTRTANRDSVLREYLGLFDGPVLVREEGTQSFLRQVGVETELGTDSVFSLGDRIRSIPPVHRGERILLAMTQVTEADRIILKPVLEALHALGLPLATITTNTSSDRGLLEDCISGVPFIAPRTWQDFVGEVASATLVISNRFHCILLSALTGTVVLPICNRQKVSAIAAEASVPVIVERLDALTPTLVRRVVDNSSLQRAAMDGYLALASKRRSSPV